MTKRKAAVETGILARETFGDFSRYRLDTFRDRFGSVVFFVADAEKTDDLGLPAIIRQCATREAALAGLRGPVPVLGTCDGSEVDLSRDRERR